MPPKHVLSDQECSAVDQNEIDGSQLLKTKSKRRNRVELADLTPLEQIRAGKSVRRLSQLFTGLMLYGFSMALFYKANLGLAPWDVFHEGVFTIVGTSLGIVTVLTGVVVLSLWIPLRQWPGLGTICNTVMIGVSLDLSLPLITAPDTLAMRVGFTLAGVVLNGLAAALYIGSQYGPGPRDGLMTGLARTSGLSIRVVRTGLELVVLGVGWLLGGTIGFGTVVYALGIGPVVQFFLTKVTVPLEESATSTELSS